MRIKAYIGPLSARRGSCLIYPESNNKGAGHVFDCSVRCFRINAFCSVPPQHDLPDGSRKHSCLPAIMTWMRASGRQCLATLTLSIEKLDKVVAKMIEIGASVK